MTGDCDDRDAQIHPDAPERCDGQDQDCDGEIDEDAFDALPQTWRDLDGDGYGSLPVGPGCPTRRFNAAAEPGDCDDAEPEVHPGAVDACGDGIDSDCDGLDSLTDVTSPEGAFASLDAAVISRATRIELCGAHRLTVPVRSDKNLFDLEGRGDDVRLELATPDSALDVGGRLRIRDLALTGDVPLGRAGSAVLYDVDVSEVSLGGAAPWLDLDGDEAVVVLEGLSLRDVQTAGQPVLRAQAAGRASDVNLTLQAGGLALDAVDTGAAPIVVLEGELVQVQTDRGGIAAETCTSSAVLAVRGEGVQIDLERLTASGPSCGPLLDVESGDEALAIELRDPVAPALVRVQRATRGGSVSILNGTCTGHASRPCVSTDGVDQLRMRRTVLDGVQTTADGVVEVRNASRATLIQTHLTATSSSLGALVVENVEIVEFSYANFGTRETDNDPADAWDGSPVRGWGVLRGSCRPPLADCATP